MKASRLTLLSCCVLILLLTACSRSVPTTTPDPNQISTQVNQLLTSIPAQTQLPTAVITNVPPTGTLPPAPTATQQPTATNTAIVPTATSIVQKSPTPAPTTAASATAPAATAPSTTGDPRTTLGKPTHEDKFDTSQGWGLYEDEHVKVEEGSGFLKFTAINADAWHGWTLANPTLANFYIEATAKPGTCSGKDSYGLMVRAPDPNQGYFLEFSCDGAFKFQRWDGSKFLVLLNWTENSAIKSGAGQENRMGLKAEGDRFTIYANGVKVGEASDASYSEGRYGLFVSASSTTGFTVEVDEVDYWTLP